MYDSDRAAADYLATFEKFECAALELPDEFLTVKYDVEHVDARQWKFHPLYNIDARGVERVWQIGFDGVSIWTLYGPTTKTTISTSEVVLTKSSETLSDQALILCRAARLRKVRRDYKALDDDVKTSVVIGMKGYDYEKGCIKLFPVILDFKLDGIRAMIKYVNGEVTLMSYGGIPMNHITHISVQVGELLKFLPPGCMVDGELYKHGYGFHDIQSIIRSHVNIHKDITTIDFYMFDIYFIDNPIIEDRMKIVTDAYDKYISSINYDTSVKLLNKWYAYSEEEIQSGFQEALRRGYEGVTIRHSSIGRKQGSRAWKMSRYCPGRTKAIFKLKQYYDDEGVIVAIAATKGKEKNLCKLIVKTYIGYNLPVRYGNALQKSQWNLNPSLILGKVLKYKYPSVHPVTKVPQRAVGIGIRENFA